MPYTAWQEKAAALREAANTEDDPLVRRTLLVLAEDCETIAAEIEAGGQPGKPKPPGNPPKRAGREQPRPVTEPPRSMPVPRAEKPPPRLSARK